MTQGFEEAYREGVPPWDIGRPQPEIVRLELAGEIRGAVLDIGCGTGENALFLATRGHAVLGIDASPTAVERARAKAIERGVDLPFRVMDALALDGFARFDAAIDSGLFHAFDDDARPAFAASVASVLRPGGTAYVLCFSEHEPTDWGGPRRVTQAEIRETFRAGWRVRYIRSARFATNVHPRGGAAWLAALERTAEDEAAEAL